MVEGLHRNPNNACVAHAVKPDCFCIALARALGGEVVSSDDHEFGPLMPLGLCPIRLRPHVRPIQARTATSISVVGTDGGNAASHELPERSQSAP